MLNISQDLYEVQTYSTQGQRHSRRPDEEFAKYFETNPDHAPNDDVNRRVLFLIKNRCMKCDRRGPVAKCGGCEFQRYCSSECQRRDWKTHKKNCTTLDSYNARWTTFRQDKRGKHYTFKKGVDGPIDPYETVMIVYK